MLLRCVVILAILQSVSVCAFGEGDAKLPISDEATQTAALDVVTEVYKADYESTRSNEQKAALAKKMLQDSAATKDATNRYILLRVANDIAAEACEVDTAFVVISAMDIRPNTDTEICKK